MNEKSIFRMEENDDDGFTKAVFWLFALFMVVFLVLLGIGTWAFVEVIQWLTSK